MSFSSALRRGKSVIYILGCSHKQVVPFLERIGELGLMVVHQREIDHDDERFVESKGCEDGAGA